MQFYETTKLSVMEGILKQGDIYANIDYGIVYIDKVLYIEFEEY